MVEKIKMDKLDQEVHHVLKKSRERRQGFFMGVGSTLVAVVVIVFILILLPQSRPHSTETKLNMSQAAFKISVSRQELNALVDEYLNKDESLKDNIRFEMTDDAMMLYGTYRLLGQNIDFGLKMTPEVTKKGNVLLHADSVAIGQLPLPVKYVMHYLGQRIALPKWLTIDSNKQTLLIDSSKLPAIQGMHFKAVTINPAQDKFIFRGGFEK